MHVSDDDTMEQEGQGLAITADYADFSQIIQELSCIDMVFPSVNPQVAYTMTFLFKALSQWLH